MIFIETKCSNCGEHDETGEGYVSALNDFYCIDCARKIYQTTFALKDFKKSLAIKNKVQ